MERRSVLAFGSPGTCHWCGYDPARGEHGMIGPSDDPEKVKVSCRVPFDITEKPPVMDVLYGTGTFRTHRIERDIDGKT